MSREQLEAELERARELAYEALLPMFRTVAVPDVWLALNRACDLKPEPALIFALLVTLVPLLRDNASETVLAADVLLLGPTPEGKAALIRLGERLGLDVLRAGGVQ